MEGARWGLALVVDRDGGEVSQRRARGVVRERRVLQAAGADDEDPGRVELLGLEEVAQDLDGVAFRGALEAEGRRAADQWTMARVVRRTVRSGRSGMTAEWLIRALTAQEAGGRSGCRSIGWSRRAYLRDIEAG